jgi:hypothetical protein
MVGEGYQDQQAYIVLFLYMRASAQGTGRQGIQRCRVIEQPTAPSLHTSRYATQLLLSKMLDGRWDAWRERTGNSHVTLVLCVFFRLKLEAHFTRLLEWLTS